MQIDDNYIISEFKTNRGAVNRYRLLRASDEELEYINNRYNDSESVEESIIRIFNGYDVHPLCPICGKPLKLAKQKWRTYCSISCKSKDMANILESKYGVRSTLRLQKNQEKTKQTLLKHYGVDNPLKSNDVRNKIKQSNIIRYGVEYVSQSDEIKNKIKQTCINKFGSEYYLTSQDCKEKTLNKFGVDNYRKTNECKQLVSQYQKKHKDELNNKRKITSNIKYNTNNPTQNDEVKQKIKNTCLEKYGTTTWSQSSEGKKKLSNILSSPEIKQKIINTKTKNNSFHISNAEYKSYILLENKFSNVIRQYKSKEYPFMCDFYIPSLDLYIECNYHWTHGRHPFNENDKNDIEVLNKWKAKNTKYYFGAIYTWTIRDINKRNIAKQNNLNYLEFWNINELIEWIKGQ